MQKLFSVHTPPYFTITGCQYQFVSTTLNIDQISNAASVEIMSHSVTDTRDGSQFKILRCLNVDAYAPTTINAYQRES